MAPTGNDIFAAELDGQSVGSRVEYRVVARDADGNETPSPASDLPMLQFDVISLSGSPVLFVALRDADAVGVIDMGTGEEVAHIPTWRGALKRFDDAGTSVICLSPIRGGSAGTS